MRSLLRRACLALPCIFASPLVAQQWRTGKVAEIFVLNCANCHGPNLQGGSAPSLLDDVWAHGSDDDSLTRSILKGYPENGMPAWSTVFSETQARTLVAYIREVRTKFQYDQKPFPAPAESMVVQSRLHDYQLNTWIGDLEEPWSLAFLPGPGERAIVTEKRGQAYLIEHGKRAPQPIAGLPTNIETKGQGGLYDVVAHPHYAKNGWLYFAYADLQPQGSITRVIRGRLRDGALVDQQEIFQVRPEHYMNNGRAHYGGRLAFDRAGYLYLTLGERNQRELAQDLSRPNGKVHRLHDDGRIPDDNPFANNPHALPSIWTLGHRNPQGLALDPVSGDLYELEHGPRGGDELNRLAAGHNYGWPIITYGIEYSGEPISESTHRDGMDQPLAYWTPSLGVCGLNFYSGDLFPRWKNHLFFASLSGEELRRLEVKGDQVIEQEVLFKGIGRIRHVIGGPDGALYVLLPNRIARLSPAKAGIKD